MEAGDCPTLNMNAMEIYLLSQSLKGLELEFFNCKLNVHCAATESTPDQYTRPHPRIKFSELKDDSVLFLYKGNGFQYLTHLPDIKKIHSIQSVWIL